VVAWLSGGGGGHIEVACVVDAVRDIKYYKF